ncbi:DUF2964 family protein [Paraburkholderia strydomiana]|uniref:DUF2964 family protein n=1 Tax=Paraburkholderia strydomiana TaxID=1245417 RepID=UPI0038B71697
MIRSDTRIHLAAITVFVSLAGIAASIRGVLFDEPSLFRYGVIAVVGGVACFVLLLNPTRDADS